MTEPKDYSPQGINGLVMAEKTIFERSAAGRVGFELPPNDVPLRSPSKYVRKLPAELPEVSELDVIRSLIFLALPIVFPGNSLAGVSGFAT